MKFKARAIGWLIPWAAESLHLWPCPLGPAAEYDQEASVLHPPTALHYSKFTLALLTYHERQWEINSRLLSGEDKFEGRDENPLLPHACVYVLYQSFHRDSRYLTFSCCSHSCCSCIQLCYRTQMLWHLSIPGDAKLPQLILWSYCVLSFGSRGASQSPYKNPEHFLCVTQCMCYSNACEHLA